MTATKPPALEVFVDEFENAWTAEQLASEKYAAKRDNCLRYVLDPELSIPRYCRGPSGDDLIPRVGDVFDRFGDGRKFTVESIASDGWPVVGVEHFNPINARLHFRTTPKLRGDGITDDTEAICAEMSAGTSCSPPPVLVNNGVRYVREDMVPKVTSKVVGYRIKRDGVGYPYLEMFDNAGDSRWGTRDESCLFGTKRAAKKILKLIRSACLGADKVRLVKIVRPRRTT